jgi:hypothetical protein
MLAIALAVGGMTDGPVGQKTDLVGGVAGLDQLDSEHVGSVDLLDASAVGDDEETAGPFLSRSRFAFTSLAGTDICGRHKAQRSCFAPCSVAHMLRGGWRDSDRWFGHGAGTSLADAYVSMPGSGLQAGEPESRLGKPTHDRRWSLLICRGHRSMSLTVFKRSWSR